MSKATGDRLLTFIERIERLEEEKAQIATDIRSVKAEAKAAGFDVKAMNQMLRERRMSEAEREEHIAINEVYRAALGMLRGTPLGDAARRRLSGQAAPDARPSNGATPDDGDSAALDLPPDEPPAGAMSAETIEAAREAGRAAHGEGKKVTDNPFVNGDPRRAAWDEGWCSAAGSTGMDIPDAWRRKPKPKPSKSDQPSSPNGGSA